MNEIAHKFEIGESVIFKKSLQKKHGIIISKERSYGLPTYRVKIENDVWTLCEDDIGKC